MAIIPRIYQKMAVKLGLKGLRSRMKRALVVLATGLGKTITTALIAKAFRPKRMLFLVHNNFILKDAIKDYKLVFPEKTKMAIYNGLTKEGAEGADIVFATWQTMGQCLKLWKRDHFDLIVVDEAHHEGAETYRPVTKYFTGAKLGITATPDREDDVDIRDVFGPEVINVSLEEAIARGWLPRIEYHVITDESLDEEALEEIAQEIRQGKKRFTMAEVNRRIFIKKRDEEIARIINGYDEKAVVFCASIPHTEAMARFLNQSATFHSRTGRGQKETWDNNQSVLADFEVGGIRRVCAVDAFNEGVNVPSIGLVAFCRVTDVVRVFLQQLGRGLRPGKERLIVLDFVGNLERIQMVREIMNKIADLYEKYTPKNKLKRENCGREVFEVVGKGFEFTFSDKVVDLMKLLEHCEREFYPTWQEASKAAVALGILTVEDYKSKYKGDVRLPYQPELMYRDFPGYVTFLGKEVKDFYPTWQEAGKAAIDLGIDSKVAYQELYKKDKRLPVHPSKYYPDFPGFPMFLEKSGARLREKLYETWQEASVAAIQLGIDGGPRHYRLNYKKDPKLPSSPPSKYKDFPGWDEFLKVTISKSAACSVKKSVTGPYATLEDVAEAVARLDIETMSDYSQQYHRDARLVPKPFKHYAEWKGISQFFALVRRKKKHLEPVKE